MNPLSKLHTPTVLAATLFALSTVLCVPVPTPAASRKPNQVQVQVAKSKKDQRETRATKPSAGSKATHSVVKNQQAKPQAKLSAATEKGRNTSKPAIKQSRRAEESHRAEVARAERERANNESIREDVQSMIAKDDLSGEDPEIRRVALDALGNHAGTVVVMDPKTGRVYSMVNQQWAVREGFKPCSTIKLITGLAGLNEDVINPDDTTKIADSNDVSLTKALAYSKNEYFQKVGGEVGFEKMLSYARQLGLGEKTGINMRNESAGSLPDPQARPGIARMSSHGDDFQVTALQLATLVSAMGNGGKLVTPYVVRSRQDELKFKTRIRRQVRLNPEAWTTMVPGMVGAVNYGSGYKARDPRQTVAGKTGTCIERGSWVGLFTSYAPLSNPKLAVVVIARGADAQNHFPAAVAGRIYRELDSRFDSSGVERAVARKIEVSEKPVPARFSRDDVNEMANRTQLGVRRSSNPTVQPVLMEVPRRREPAREVDVNEAAPNGTDGLTRPRRVSSR